ncbi:MAG: hypothetical protein KIT14_18605 [bacterium]|nr:hypothetical protein [bacterium]
MGQGWVGYGVWGVTALALALGGCAAKRPVLEVESNVTNVWSGDQRQRAAAGETGEAPAEGLGSGPAAGGAGPTGAVPAAIAPGAPTEVPASAGWTVTAGSAAGGPMPAAPEPSRMMPGYPPGFADPEAVASDTAVPAPAAASATVGRTAPPPPGGADIAAPVEAPGQGAGAPGGTASVPGFPAQSGTPQGGVPRDAPAQAFSAHGTPAQAIQVRGWQTPDGRGWARPDRRPAAPAAATAPAVGPGAGAGAD